MGKSSTPPIEEPTAPLTAEEIRSADRLIMAGPISLKKQFCHQSLGSAIFWATWIVLMLGVKYIEVVQHQAKATVYWNGFLFDLWALPIIVVLFIGTPLLFRYAKARKKYGPELIEFRRFEIDSESIRIISPNGERQYRWKSFGPVTMIANEVKLCVLGGLDAVLLDSSFFANKKAQKMMLYKLDYWRAEAARKAKRLPSKPFSGDDPKLQALLDSSKETQAGNL